jgi:hypothetical protein
VASLCSWLCFALRHRVALSSCFDTSREPLRVFTGLAQRAARCSFFRDSTLPSRKPSAARATCSIHELAAWRSLQRDPCGRLDTPIAMRPGEYNGPQQGVRAITLRLAHALAARKRPTQHAMIARAPFPKRRNGRVGIGPRSARSRDLHCARTSAQRSGAALVPCDPARREAWQAAGSRCARGSRVAAFVWQGRIQPDPNSWGFPCRGAQR